MTRIYDGRSLPGGHATPFCVLTSKDGGGEPDSLNDRVANLATVLLRLTTAAEKVVKRGSGGQLNRSPCPWGEGQTRCPHAPFHLCPSVVLQPGPSTFHPWGGPWMPNSVGGLVGGGSLAHPAFLSPPPRSCCFLRLQPQSGGCPVLPDSDGGGKLQPRPL